MKDNLSIVITIIIFVLLIIIFPLYNYFERQDDMSYNVVLKSTTNFVDEVLNSGYINQEMYDKFCNEIAATGNLYEVEIEAHKKIITKDLNVADEYTEQYKIDYNDDIFESFDDTSAKIQSLDKKTLKNGSYLLNENDQFYVKLKNSSTTMAGALFNTIVTTSKKDRISVNYGGVVKNNSWQEVASTFIGYNTYDIKVTSSPDIVSGAYVKEDVIIFDIFGLSDELLALPIGKLKYEWTIKYQDNKIQKISGSNRSIDYNFNGKLGKAEVSVIVTDTVGNESFSDTLKFEVLKSNMQSPIITTNPNVANGGTINVIPKTITFDISNKTDVKTYKWEILNQSGNVIYTNTSTSISNILYNFTVDGTYIVKATVYNIFNEAYTTSYQIIVSSLDKTPPIIDLSITSKPEEIKTIYADIYDNESEVVITKWAKGLEYIENFAFTGTEIIGSEFEVTENGTYTVYAKNTDGYESIETIIVENVIDFAISKGFTYTGSVQSYTIPCTGKYLFTIQGASGGNDFDQYGNGGYGGKGAYVSGYKDLKKDDIVYIYVGGAGATQINNGGGGWNGGGNSGIIGGSGGGGGATDIRFGGTSLNDRIIVAGGGGGAGYDFSKGGYGGTGGGGNGSNSNRNGAKVYAAGTSANGNGSFGQGANHTNDGGGGGGGYYGGGAGDNDPSGNPDNGGGGGSSYVGKVYSSYTLAGYRTGNGLANIQYILED